MISGEATVTADVRRRDTVCVESAVSGVLVHTRAAGAHLDFVSQYLSQFAELKSGPQTTPLLNQ